MSLPSRPVGSRLRKTETNAALRLLAGGFFAMHEVNCVVVWLLSKDGGRTYPRSSRLSQSSWVGVYCLELITRGF